jgi:hypothetical protein
MSDWLYRVRRLVVRAESRAKGGDMKHIHRPSDRRVKRTYRRIDLRVPAVRQQAIIPYAYIRYV